VEPSFGPLTEAPCCQEDISALNRCRPRRRPRRREPQTEELELSTTPNRQSATTHIVEVSQIVEINRRLTNSVSPVITAGELGMTGTDVAGSAPDTLDASAVLLNLTWEGSTEPPIVHGHFRNPGSDPTGSVGLSSDALKVVSRRLHLQQRWGM
jgi:hypothetical protein